MTAAYLTEVEDNEIYLQESNLIIIYCFPSLDFTPSKHGDLPNSPNHILILLTIHCKTFHCLQIWI